MNPLLQNLLVTLLSFIYVFGVVRILDYLVKKGLSQGTLKKSLALFLENIDFVVKVRLLDLYQN